MGTVHEKMELIAKECKALGICKDEVDDARRALRDYDQAKRALTSAEESLGAGSLATVAGIVTSFTCTPGPQFVVCLVASGVAVVSGGLETNSAVDDWLLADEEIDDAFGELMEALDDLCRCVKRHLRQ